MIIHMQNWEHVRGSFDYPCNLYCHCVSHIFEPPAIPELLLKDSLIDLETIINDCGPGAEGFEKHSLTDAESVSQLDIAVLPRNREQHQESVCWPIPNPASDSMFTRAIRDCCSVYAFGMIYFTRTGRLLLFLSLLN